MVNALFLRKQCRFNSKFSNTNVKKINRIKLSCNFILTITCTLKMYVCIYTYTVYIVFFCYRFSMLVEGGIVKAVNIEPDGHSLTCTIAKTLTEQI